MVNASEAGSWKRRKVMPSLHFGVLMALMAKLISDIEILSEAPVIKKEDAPDGDELEKVRLEWTNQLPACRVIFLAVMTLFAKVSDSGWIIPAAWLASENISIELYLYQLYTAVLSKTHNCWYSWPNLLQPFFMLELILTLRKGLASPWRKPWLH